MKTEYVPFTEEMLREAGHLLAQRHACNRKKLPFLPKRFEDLQVARKAVETLWKEKLKNGYAAFQNGSMVAYLLGERTTNPWGRDGYVYLPGYALADDQSPAILQDLYALLGNDWVKKGFFDHSLYISAADQEVLSAFFDLGFGKQRVDALMEFSTLEIPKVEEPSGITICKAGTGDNAQLGSLSGVIFKALAKPPYWHPTVPEVWDELYEGWSTV